jgi:hypothetical protein
MVAHLRRHRTPLAREWQLAAIWCRRGPGQPGAMSTNRLK